MLRTIYIFGDSHAYNLFPSVKEVSEEFGYKNLFYLATDWTKNDEIYIKGDKYLRQISDDDLLIFSARQNIHPEEIIRSKIEFYLNH